MTANGTELVRQDQQIAAQDEQQRFLPVMSLQVAVERRKAIIGAVNELMTKSGPDDADGDYGVIPGTKKPTLLQPGADKLNSLFGLIPTFEIIEKELDWTGANHGGEPFFYFEIKCRLLRNGFVMGEGDGSANSWESRYRYRKAERECPACGAPAIIKGKAEYGGGWVCFAKKGGCGAKYKDGDEEIESQVVGYVPNPNIFDLVNTVRKIANKRAKIAATLNATSAHEFFTQDAEDFSPDTFSPAERQTDKNAPPPPAPAPHRPEISEAEMQFRNRVGATQDRYELLNIFAELKDDCQQLMGEEQGLAAYRSVLRQYGVEKCDQFSKRADAQRCAIELWKHIQSARTTPAAPADVIDENDKETWIDPIIGGTTHRENPNG